MTNELSTDTKLFSFKREEPDLEKMKQELTTAGQHLANGQTVEDDLGFVYIPRTLRLGVEVFHVNSPIRRCAIYTVLEVEDVAVANDDFAGIRFEALGGIWPSNNPESISVSLLHYMVKAARKAGDSRYTKMVTPSVSNSTETKN